MHRLEGKPDSVEIGVILRVGMVVEFPNRAIESTGRVTRISSDGITIRWFCTDPEYCTVPILSAELVQIRKPVEIPGTRLCDMTCIHGEYVPSPQPSKSKASGDKALGTPLPLGPLFLESASDSVNGSCTYTRTSTHQT